ncbi:hypothetical protein BCR36DRAFT_152282 [Piromyces finnis]|uniref:Uncharacterized protein n=1 Tax=Piromyces finnis TaxID=1754191 RepID=A0A1Y1VIB8_9FUNG|nr:hypothetical protein BCR36DRAFT_152282 [Piromyces finnis]|eukprot:ORX57146.1 hypothetical protein BCR36DRAFT_152282 [Piromyces finnis]
MPSKNNTQQDHPLILYPEFHTFPSSPLKSKEIIEMTNNETQQQQQQRQKLDNNEIHDTEENLLEIETPTFSDFLFHIKEKIGEDGDIDNNEYLHPHYQTFHPRPLSFISTSTNTTATTTNTIMPTHINRSNSVISSNTNKNKHNSLSSRSSLLPLTTNYTLTKQSIKNIINQTIISQMHSPKMLFLPLNDMCSSISKSSSIKSYPKRSLSYQSQQAQQQKIEEEEEKENQDKKYIERKNRNHATNNNYIKETDIEIVSKENVNTMVNIPDTFSKNNNNNNNELNNINHLKNQNNPNNPTIRNEDDNSLTSYPLVSSNENNDDQHQPQRQNYSFQYTFQYYLLQIFDQLLLRNEQVKWYRAYQGEREDKSLSNPFFLEFFLLILLDTFSQGFLGLLNHHYKIDELWITLLFIYFNQCLLQKQLKRPYLQPLSCHSHYFQKPNFYQKRGIKGVSPISKFKQVFKGELHRLHLRNYNSTHQNSPSVTKEINFNSNSNNWIDYEKELWQGMKALSRIQRYIRCSRHHQSSPPHSAESDPMYHKKKRGLHRIFKKKNQSQESIEKRKKTIVSSISSLTLLSPSSSVSNKTNITANPNSFISYYMQYKKNKKRQELLSKEKRKVYDKGETITSHELKETSSTVSQKVKPVGFKHKDSLKCYHSNNSRKQKLKSKENMTMTTTAITTLEKKSIIDNGDIKEKNNDEQKTVLSEDGSKSKDTILLSYQESPTPIIPSMTTDSTLPKKAANTLITPTHPPLNHRQFDISKEAIQIMEEKYQRSKEPKIDEQILSSFYRFLVQEDQAHRRTKYPSPTNSFKNEKDQKVKEKRQGNKTVDKDTHDQQQGKSHNSYSSFFSYNSDSFYEHEYAFDSCSSSRSHRSCSCGSEEGSNKSESVKENDSDIESEMGQHHDTEVEYHHNNHSLNELPSFSYIDDKKGSGFTFLNDNIKSFCCSSVSSISLSSFSGISFQEQSSFEKEEEEEKEEKGKEASKMKKETFFDNENENNKNIDNDNDDDNNNYNNNNNNDNNNDNNDNKIQCPSNEGDHKMVKRNVIEKQPDLQKEHQDSYQSLGLQRTVSLTRLKDYQKQQQQSQSQSPSYTLLQRPLNKLESSLSSSPPQQEFQNQKLASQPLQQPLPSSSTQEQREFRKQGLYRSLSLSSGSKQGSSRSISSLEQDIQKQREKQFSFSPPFISLNENEKDFYVLTRRNGSLHLPQHHPSSHHIYPFFTPLQRSLSTSTHRGTSRDLGMYNGSIEHKSSWTSSSVFSLPTIRKSNSTRSWKKEEQKGNKKGIHFTNLIKRKKDGSESISSEDSEFKRIPQIKKEVMSITPSSKESQTPSIQSLDRTSPSKNPPSNNINNGSISSSSNNSNKKKMNEIKDENYMIYSPTTKSSTQSSQMKEKGFKLSKMKKQPSLSSLIFRHKYHHQKSTSQQQQQQQQQQPKQPQSHFLSSPLSFFVPSPKTVPIKKSPSMSQVLSNPRKRGRDRSSLNAPINYSLLPLTGFDEEEELHLMEEEFFIKSPETIMTTTTITATLLDDGEHSSKTGSRQTFISTLRSGHEEEEREREKDPNLTMSSSMATVATSTSITETTMMSEAMTFTTTTTPTNKVKGKKSKHYLKAIKSSLELLKIKNGHGHGHHFRDENRQGRSNSNKTYDSSSRASSLTTIANDSIIDDYPYSSMNTANYHYHFGEGSVTFQETKNTPSKNLYQKMKKLKKVKKNNKNEKKFTASSSSTSISTTTTTTTTNIPKKMPINKKTSSATLFSPLPPYQSNLYHIEDDEFDFDAMDVATVINTNTTVQNVILEEDMVTGKEDSFMKEKLTTNKPIISYNKNVSSLPFSKASDPTDYSLTTMLPLPSSSSESEIKSDDDYQKSEEKINTNINTNTNANININTNTSINTSIYTNANTDLYVHVHSNDGTSMTKESRPHFQPSFFVHRDNEEREGEGGEEDLDQEGQILSGLSSLALTPIPHSASPTLYKMYSNNDSTLTSFDTPVISGGPSLSMIKPPYVEEEEEEEKEEEKELKKEITPSSPYPSSLPPVKEIQEMEETMDKTIKIKINSNTTNHPLPPLPSHTTNNGCDPLDTKEIFTNSYDIPLPPPSPTISFSIRPLTPMKSTEYTTGYNKEDPITSTTPFSYNLSPSRQYQSHRVSSSQYSLKSNFSKKSILSLMNLFKHRKK